MGEGAVTGIKMSYWTGMVERALLFADSAHGDQIDKGGNPYIDHLISVANSAGEMWEANTKQPALRDIERVVMVGLLHDVLEDTDASIRHMLEFGIPHQVVRTVMTLTHLKYEPRFEYIERISADEFAAVVKMADLKDNMRLERLGRPATQADHDRNAKYGDELKYLSMKWRNDY
jgi:(p)ppGpp synthase/HD superfamily hydrolase